MAFPSGTSAGGLYMKVGMQLNKSEVRKFQQEATDVVNKVQKLANGSINYTKTMKDANGSVLTFSKTVSKLGQSSDYTLKSFKDTTKHIQQSNSTIQQTNNAMNQLQNSTYQVSRVTKTLGEDFLETGAKVLKFGVITKIIGLFTDAIKESVTIVKDFDDALTEMKKVSDLSGESLDNYTKHLGELGETVARTRTEMVDSATNFIKSGFTEDESAELARVANLFINIADSELEAGEASNFIISQMKAFNIETSNAIDVIDKINEV